MAKTLKDIRDKVYEALADVSTTPVSISTSALDAIINDNIRSVAETLNSLVKLVDFTLLTGEQVISLTTKISNEVSMISRLYLLDGTTYARVRYVPSYGVVDATENGKPAKYTVEGAEGLVRFDKIADQDYSMRFYGTIIPADLVNDTDPLALPASQERIVRYLTIAEVFPLLGEADLAAYYLKKATDSIASNKDKNFVPEEAGEGMMGFPPR